MTFDCRSCGAPLQHTFVDLGLSPLANAYVRNPDEPEVFYPLHVRICDSCMLVQLPEVARPDEIFSDYAYFSSYSSSWLAHAREFAQWAIRSLELTNDDLVLEVGSNDGYLLQYFVERGVSVLGVDPAANVTQVANERGVPTRTAFFSLDVARDLAAEGVRPRLIIGNNVLAHVPELNDFVAGLAHLLAPEGVISLEFPHLMRLIEETEFDTIYHEHFSYFSLLSVERVMHRHGLAIFDVHELPTHGGSLRLLVQHRRGSGRPVQPAVDEVRSAELRKGYGEIETYLAFAPRVAEVRRRLVNFVLEETTKGKRIVAYGAAAKGNTLLNYCGLRADSIEFVADRNPHKQGLYLPGSRIPIVDPERVKESRPDYVLILPWNIADEIMSDLGFVREWGGRFLTPIPILTVHE